LFGLNGRNAPGKAGLISDDANPKRESNKSEPLLLFGLNGRNAPGKAGLISEYVNPIKI
jgi:hypothetical protein